MEKTKHIVVIFILAVLLTLNTNIYASSIEYRGKSEGLIGTTGNLFSEFGTLRPGDKKSGYVELRNITNNDIELFFKTEPINVTDERVKKLLNLVDLKIELEHDGKITQIYNGKLEATGLNKYVSLGNYEKGYDGKFYFELNVPLSMDNDYSLLEVDNIEWTFMVEDRTEDESEAGGYEANVNTGDDIYLYLELIVISVILYLIIIDIRRKREENND